MKNLNYLILTILLVSLAGCYTQVATNDGRYSKKYHERDYEDSYDRNDSAYGDDYRADDTTYYADNYRDGAIINNYYFGDSYRPYYRRYYRGYYPGFSVGISVGFWDNVWYDPWSYAGWYDNYWYDPFYPSYYYNYPYFYPPYYGSYYGGYGHHYGWGNWTTYKYRSNDYSRLRSNDGSRGTSGLRSRDLLSPTRGTGLINRNLMKTRTQSEGRNITPGSRTGQMRTRDQERNTTLRKGGSGTTTPEQRESVRRRNEGQRTNPGSYTRPRNEGSRDSGQRREGRGDSERRRNTEYRPEERGGNAPQYNPPTQQQAPRRESGNEGSRSYNPPQSRGDGGSRSSAPSQSRNSGGGSGERRR